MKTKVIIVADFFYPHWTGIAKSVLYLINVLVNEYEITILTVRYDKSLKKQEEIFGVKVIRCDYIASVSRAKYSFELVQRFIRLAPLFDVVLVNSPFTNIVPIAILSKIFKKKLLILHHGDLILPKGVRNRIIEKVFDMSSYIAFTLADKVSTFTKDYAIHSRILKYHLKKFIPIIIPITKNNNNIRDNSFLKIKKQSDVLYGIAGRFVEEKGFDILFDALPSLLKVIPNAHIVFAGQTVLPYENFYNLHYKKIKKFKKSITFLGLLSPDQMQQFYEAIDYIVLPSRSDCFPLVQVEAMLAAVPSLVSDIPGARVPVKESGFGLLYPRENPSKLAEAMIQAVQRRNQLKKKYKNVLLFFNEKRNASRIKEFIEQ